jgi:S1-C subfamily serine protease
MKKQLRAIVICIRVAIASCFAVAGSEQALISAPCPQIGCQGTAFQELATQLPSEHLRSRAQAITVKVFSKEFLGSGILINRQGQVYTVVTNAHVLRSGNFPYQIQTPDQHIYPAVEVLPNQSLQGNDLAILQFRSNGAIYSQATVGDASTLKVGDEVFAAGFPLSSEEEQDRFVFTTGRISLMLGKALEGGYKIGYTNDIRKGMSGGPVLNSRGEVVAINGRHANPIWDAPDLYQDGSRLDQALQDVINHFSWAVPFPCLSSL